MTLKSVIFTYFQRIWRSMSMPSNSPELMNLYAETSVTTILTSVFIWRHQWNDLVLSQHGRKWQNFLTYIFRGFYTYLYGFCTFGSSESWSTLPRGYTVRKWSLKHLKWWFIPFYLIKHHLKSLIIINLFSE